MNRRKANCCANCKGWLEGCDEKAKTMYEVCDDFKFREPELKSCPFCGSKGNIGNNMYKTMSSRWWAYCHECGIYTKDFFSKDGAIDKWNRRAE